MKRTCPRCFFFNSCAGKLPCQHYYDPEDDDPTEERVGELIAQGRQEYRDELAEYIEDRDIGGYYL